MNELGKIITACVGSVGVLAGAGAAGGDAYIDSQLEDQEARMEAEMAVEFASKDDLIATQQATIQNQQRIIDAQDDLAAFRCESLQTTANDYVGKVIQSERNVRFYDTRLDDLPEDAPREMRELLVDAQQQAAVLLRIQEDTKAGIIESLDQNCR